MEDLRNELTSAVIGAAIEVHQTLGPGYLESGYEEALCVEFGRRSIPFDRQYAFALTYKDAQTGRGRLDLLINGQLVVELKAIEKPLPIRTAQVISYRKALDLKLGLILNFNTTVVKQGIKRVAFSH